MEEVHCMASIGDKLDLNDLVNFEEKGEYNNSIRLCILLALPY